ncbi:CBS-domain-containing membrane protein [Desulfofundulus luciae]|uniref:CBS-domain-containing membrane protein n=1 Tax=Desulfofundulus luciae TaxID=74702 RepID=A0ABU0B306_9FIRM|nr:HPP family protein [Desulfofundulus luciae]MDQ0287104.1 CBS-domain-containing membrane protein [Desulfofundulus luciae]
MSISPDSPPGIEKQDVGQPYIAIYLRKMLGSRRTAPLSAPSWKELLVSWFGTFSGIGVVAVLTLVYNMPMIVPSFGASALLIYGLPDAPLAQPRNVIGGHIISAICGVTVYALFGLTWWSAALAASLAVLLMLITRTAHPPGGATALGAVLAKASPMYILTPVALGAAILVLVGLITNNLLPERKYPRYWL